MRSPNHPQRSSKARRLTRLSLAAIALPLTSTNASAQVVLDGSLGLAGTLQGPNFAVPASSGQLRGGNLFHSFSQLSIAQGERLTFDGPGSVQNVLARVTGPNASTIDGTLATSIPGASLVLINPRGITFGPNASLDVDGSFVATTADFVRLADGGRFAASTAGETVLTSAAPAAFGFLGSAPAPVQVQGATLGVKPTRVLSVVAGDVSIVGGAILAPSGRANVVSAAAAGEVALDPGDATTSEVGASQLPARGRVTITNGRLATPGDPAGNAAGGTIRIVTGDLAVGGTSFVTSPTDGDVDGGDIHVDATGTVSVSGSAGIATQASAAGRGGDVRVDASRVEVSNAEGTAAFIGTTVTGTGRAGDVRLRAGTVRVAAADPAVAAISSDAIGEGASGNVDIVADALELDGGGAAVRTSAGGFTGTAGSAGDVILRVGALTITAGGTISSLSTGLGTGGAVDLEATGDVLLSGVSPDGVQSSGINTSTFFGFGGAKGIRIKAPKLRVADGASIGSETAFVDAAPIFIEADTLEIDGAQISALTADVGAAGDITLDVGVLDLKNAAVVRSSSGGTGRAGNITVIDAGRVRLDGNSEFGAFVAGGGQGGNISITATDLEVRGGSTVTAATINSAEGGSVNVNATRILITGPKSLVSAPSIVTGAGAQSGPGGTVTLEATESIRVEDGGRVQTSAGFPQAPGEPPDPAETTGTTGRAGNATVRAPLVVVAGRNGEERSRVVSTTSIKNPGTGAGGDVTIEASERLEVRDGGLVSADTFGTGAGGNVTVTAGDVLVDDATISASSTFEGDAAAGLTPGVAGTVRVAAARSVRLRNRALLSVESAGTDAGSIVVTATDRIRLTDSRIVTRAAGAGGNITLGSRDPDTGAINPFVILFDSSEINANAVAGNGGNIDIISDEYVTSADTIVTATSEQSDPGVVDVSAAYTELAGGLVQLPSDFASDAAALQDQCGLRVQGEQSSFIATGRGGTPLTPDGVQPSFDLRRPTR